MIFSFSFLTKVTAQDKNQFNAPVSEFKNIPQCAIYHDPNKMPEERAMDVVNRLTFDELIQLFGGYKHFNFNGIPRLGLRPIHMENSGQGIKVRKPNTFNTTSYPSVQALSATWDRELAREMGSAIGKECRIFGVDILLGPGINMQRLSVSGRNFEYMGEDPFLTSQMIVPYVKGLQSHNIIAVAKHFIGNDQELFRHFASTNIDERTMHEIYLPPYKAAIQDGGMLGLMMGNNLLNGVPCSMEKTYLNDLVRKQWGFDGMAMTDWQNTCYFPEKQELFLESGVSLLMPENNAFRKFMNDTLAVNPAYKQKLTEAFKQKAYYNLLAVFKAGLYDIPLKENLPDVKNQNKAIARTIGEEAITLLKNQDNILPIAKGTKILVMGNEELHCGDGSGRVEGYDHTNFQLGLSKDYNLKVISEINQDEIKNAEIILYRINVEGHEAGDVPFETGLDENIEKVAAINPNVVVLISSGNGLPMPWLNKVKAVIWTYYLGQERGNALANVLTGRVNPSGKLTFSLEQDFADSPAPDYNLVNGHRFWCGGNRDYKNYWLLGKKNEVLPEVIKLIKPGVPFPIDYNEGVFMGYRWWDKTKAPIYFPFGYGLSYTTFEYSNIKISNNKMSGNESLSVSFTLKNTGKTIGKEVVQLYIHDSKSSVERPEKELKGFDKVELAPNQSKTVKFTINKQDLAFWDIESHNWKTEKGEFEVWIGASSRDIKLKEKFDFK
jgi:beta-glucosidase